MKKHLLILAAITLMFIASGCGRKDSTANAAEMAAPIVSSQKPIEGNTKTGDSKLVDPVKHQVMAFDLEGLGDDGSKKWGVKGQSAESVTDNQVKLNNVVASSYGNEAQATITADSGMYDKTKNNIHLEQNVKAVIENNEKSANSFISLPSIGGAKDTPVAENAGKQKKTKTIITCEAEVEFNYEKNEAYFNKNVHVVNDDGTIDADKITIYLNKSTKTVQTIVAEGNVKIKRGENMTYSDKATYIEAEKRIVLSGQPKIIMYQEGEGPDNIFKSPK